MTNLKVFDPANPPAPKAKPKEYLRLHQENATEVLLYWCDEDGNGDWRSTDAIIRIGLQNGKLLLSTIANESGSQVQLNRIDVQEAARHIL